ncbi:MAG: hypothetical protein CM1200mP40_07020 [Gammaproteobacteria bacterium]|nr:MAG: hypothetical protein CM1200mP40_07020 [Gammaproteobacteria bacterium]
MREEHKGERLADFDLPAFFFGYALLSISQMSAFPPVPRAGEKSPPLTSDAPSFEYPNVIPTQLHLG